MPGTCVQCWKSLTAQLLELPSSRRVSPVTPWIRNELWSWSARPGACHCKTHMVMPLKNRAILEGAVHVARETHADAVILAASLSEEKRFLREALGPKARVLSAAGHNAQRDALADGEMLVLPEVHLRRRGRAKVALLEGLAAGILLPGERVVVISGNGSNGECELDTVAVIELTDDEDYLGAQIDAPLNILREVADPATFDAVLGICVELGHE